MTQEQINAGLTLEQIEQMERVLGVPDFIFMGIGVAIIIGVIIYNLIKRAKCSEIVSATCVGHKRRPQKGTVSPIYEFEWHGKMIQTHSSVYQGEGLVKKIPVGKEVKLRVNPENPLDFYTGFSLSDTWGFFLFAAMLILMPIYGAFFA